MSDKSPMLRPGIRRMLGLDVPRNDRIAAELENELQLHLELRAEQLMRQGLSADAAHTQARARYGDVSAASHEIREHAKRSAQRMQRRISFDSLTQDIRFALRTLGRSKAWTTVATVTLALGIGTSAAVFSVANNLLFDPLRYPDSDRLVLISDANKKSNVQISPAGDMIESWRAAKTIEAVEGVSTEDATYVLANEPNSARAGRISSNFVKFAGARLITGRSFAANETSASSQPVVILSEHLWKSRFGASTSVLNQQLKINDKTYVVVGVMADGIRTPSYSSDAIDMWLPFLPDSRPGGPAVARLAKGATLAQAEQELHTIFMNSPSSKAFRDNGFDVKLSKPTNSVASGTTMYMLSGAVFLLLLIACANVAHLLLARSAARERELSIRASLGAGRARIVRQLVTECLILVTAGCVGGLIIAALVLRIVSALRPPRMSELGNVPLYGSVVATTIAVSLFAALVFGIMSALTNRGTSTFDVLRSSSASTSDRRRHRLRSLLVVTENALSVVLLVGSVLLIRTMFNLYHNDPGFDATGLYAMAVDLPQSRYESAASRTAYAAQLLQQARDVPGVSDATIASNIPTRSGAMIGEWVTDAGAPASAGEGFTPMNNISPGYFAMMHTKLLAGRDLDASSVANGEVVVSQSFARQMFGSREAVGRRFRQAGAKANDPWSTIIGVVADVAVMNLRNTMAPALYYPANVVPGNHLSLIVRMKAGSLPYAPLRKVALTLDASLAPPVVLSATELLELTVAQERFVMSLLTAFAGIAVVLSAIGLYGVISYMVSQSTREIGVRVALGATRRDVTHLVMRQGFMLSVAGLLVGLLASAWGSKLLAATLYGVSTTDPASYAAGAAVLLTLAACACIAPTMRAIRIDPMVAMRSE